MTTYYIRLDMTGSDSNTGLTSDAGGAWRTFEHAVSQMVAGDKLVCRGGTYLVDAPENKIDITANGASGAWIEIEAWEDGGGIEDCWIDGQHLYPAEVQKEEQVTQYGTAKATNYKGLLTFSGNYQRWKNIHIKRSKGRGIVCDPGVGGTRQQYIDVVGTFPNNGKLIVADSYHSGITVQYTDHVLLKNLEFYGSGQYADFLRPVTLVNHPAQVKPAFVNDLIIDGIYSHDNWGEGINVSSDTVGFVVKNCKIYNTMSPMLYLHRCRQGEAFNNEIYTTPEQATFGTPNTGIYVQNESLKPNETNDAGDLLIYNNYVVAAKVGIRIGGGYQGQYGFDNVRFYFNTCINNSQTQIEISGRAPLSGIKVINNLFYVDADIAPDGDLAVIPNNHPAIVMHHNVWNSSPNGSAQGAGDVYGDLRLRNPNADITPGLFDRTNYNKLATSPAIFAGVDIPTATGDDVTTDFVGATRNNPPDAGADEYSPTDGGGGDGGGSGSGAFNVGVAQNVAPASTGTTTLTDANFGDITPKAAILFANKAASITAGRASYATAQLCIGITDGTSQASMSMRSKDNDNSNSDCRSRVSSTKTIQLIKDAATGAAAELTTAAMITNGLQLSAATAPDDPVNIIAALLGGDDIEAKVNYVAFGTGETSKVVSGLSFTPNVFFVVVANGSGTDSTAVNAMMSMGVYNHDATQYRCLEFYSAQNAATSDVRVTVYTDRVANRLTQSQAFTFSSVGSGTYTLAVSTASAIDVMVLAMRIDGAEFSISTGDTATATGDKQYSVGYEAALGLLFATLTTATGTTSTDSDANAIGVGAFTENAAHAMGYTDEDGLTTTDTESQYAADALVLRKLTGTDFIVADENGMASPGPTLNYATVDSTARKMLLFAIEKVSSATITADFSADTVSGQAPLTVNFTDDSTAEGTTITEWIYQFGDNQSSTSQDPQHIYTDPGTYTVTLAASDGTIVGTKVRTAYITVTPAPVAPPTISTIPAAGATEPDPLAAPVGVAAV